MWLHTNGAQARQHPDWHPTSLKHCQTVKSGPGIFCSMQLLQPIMHCSTAAAQPAHTAIDGVDADCRTCSMAVDAAVAQAVHIQPLQMAVTKIHQSIQHMLPTCSSPSKQMAAQQTRQAWTVVPSWTSELNVDGHRAVIAGLRLAVPDAFKARPVVAAGPIGLAAPLHQRHTC